MVTKKGANRPPYITIELLGVRTILPFDEERAHVYPKVTNSDEYTPVIYTKSAQGPDNTVSYWTLDILGTGMGLGRVLREFVQRPDDPEDAENAAKKFLKLYGNKQVKVLKLSAVDPSKQICSREYILGLIKER